jgi:hypothetical protein
MLKEVNYLVDLSTRLKEETGAGPKWKRTASDLHGIIECMKEISKKIKRIG